jgi:microcystin-dependent protein
MSIQQNQALFSLIGTSYGGNGVQTFALPNLQGTKAIGTGSGNSTNYLVGQVGGSPTASLALSNLPAHTHTANGSTVTAASTTPVNTVLASPSDVGLNYYSTNPKPTLTTMAPAMVGMTGSSQPFSVMQPYLILNFCIALVGIFPSRN